MKIIHTKYNYSWHHSGNTSNTYIKNNKGEFHHDFDEPAYKYFHNDILVEETFYKNNKFHRDIGPACIKYYATGEIQRKCYCKNNKLENESGPAVIDYLKNGTIESVRYYCHDIEFESLEEIRLYKKTLCLR